ncbi:MAG: hypothetical protein E7663_00110 [Ruminococcaceae bacterium]|nr:hypothetical protein [Oscillospiraceae bacterium]
MVKKRLIKYGVLVVAVVIAFVGIFAISRTAFSRKIVKLIRERDYVHLEKMCEAHPGSIDHVPWIHQFFGALAEKPEILTPLQEACLRNDMMAVEILVEHGADPNVNSHFASEYPLSYAVSKGNLPMTKLLVDHGADIALCREKLCYNLAVYARNEHANMCIEEYIEMVELLEQNGMDFLEGDSSSSCNIFLNTALLNDLEAASYWLDCKNVLVDQTDSKGRNALHLAVLTGHIRPKLQFVQFLVDRGIDPCAMDYDGKTAYDHAVERGCTEIAEYLKERM